jgi:hypothetical protein
MTTSVLTKLGIVWEKEEGTKVQSIRRRHKGAEAQREKEEGTKVQSFLKEKSPKRARPIGINGLISFLRLS